MSGQSGNFQANPWWAVVRNPILRRYARSRLRPKGLIVSLILSVLGAGFIFSIARSVGQFRINLSVADAERGPLVPLFFMQSVILFVLGTAQVAGGMVAERDEGVIDYQRLIPMSPLGKVIGFLFGLPSREWVMFASTLPFTAWCLWYGEVEAWAWMKLYAALIVSALTYHLTGMVTGTVVRNRRWAFLTSIGLVFCLYTVIPQLAKFGLVFFKYLTISPVLQESLTAILPKDAAAAIELKRRLLPEPKFFGLDMSEFTFTLFSQAGLILTLVAMSCRRWKRPEAHLLGKTWAVGFFLWVQLMLLGNALPLIDPGDLFPSQGVLRMLGGGLHRPPEQMEAVVISGVYGFFTMILLWIFAAIITPSPDRQKSGFRRSFKLGRSRLPFTGDEGPAAPWMLCMIVIGTGGWYWFTVSMVESRWFPGQTVPVAVAAVFGAVLLSATLAIQTSLEARGSKVLGVVALLAAVVPLMVGAVLVSVSDPLMSVAAWVVGMSPLALPVYAPCSLLELSELPPLLVRALPRAFWFWLIVWSVVCVWRLVRLRARRRSMMPRTAPEGDPSPGQD